MLDQSGPFINKHIFHHFFPQLQYLPSQHKLFTTSQSHHFVTITTESFWQTLSHSMLGICKFFNLIICQLLNSTTRLVQKKANYPVSQTINFNQSTNQSIHFHSTYHTSYRENTRIALVQGFSSGHPWAKSSPRTTLVWPFDHLWNT